ncbi:MAG: hypothetical protein CL878_12065 [Dehalococcoidia bacterium]|nr:hypothetical protein [Dehalococcoidia bacterium]
MSEGMQINRVRSVTSGIPGRSLNSARTNHFVIDHAGHAGGPAEAPTPAESFLAGISACGALLIEGQAEEDGLPLQRAEVAIEGMRSPENLADFVGINIRFDLHGVTQEQAAQLVEVYKDR